MIDNVKTQEDRIVFLEKQATFALAVLQDLLVWLGDRHPHHRAELLEILANADARARSD